LHIHAVLIRSYVAVVFTDCILRFLEPQLPPGASGCFRLRPFNDSLGLPSTFSAVLRLEKGKTGLVAPDLILSEQYCGVLSSVAVSIRYSDHLGGQPVFGVGSWWIIHLPIQEFIHESKEGSQSPRVMRDPEVQE
jgi:hypothetical protein